METLESRVRIQSRMMGFLVLVVGVLGVLQMSRPLEAVQRSLPADSILRVRGLVVVDEHGTDRVWIGAPLPDPPHFGRRISRGGNYAGIILMDATGTERSGYATTAEGQVMITLDEVGRMVANFMAQPAGGVRLQLTDEFDNGLRLGTSRSGPFIQLTRSGRPILTLPDSAGR